MKLVRPKDSVALVHFYDRDNSDLEYLKELQSYFESELNTNGPVESSFRIIEKIGVMTKVAIADYANEYDPDFFVIAPRATISISTVSTYVVNHVSASVVFVKV